MGSMQNTATEIFTITQAVLVAAAPGVNVPVTATQLPGGLIDCDAGTMNILTLALTFPAII